MSIPTLKKMDLIVPSPKRKRNRNWTLPPRRGQVKIRIFKTIFTSIASTTVKEMPRRGKKGVGTLDQAPPPLLQSQLGTQFRCPGEGRLRSESSRLYSLQIASTTLKERPKKMEERGRDLRSSSTTAAATTTGYTIQMDH